MKYSREIFEILSRGGFISGNSVSALTRHMYDAIEEQRDQYAEYYRGVGFELQGGNGYWYFSRNETKVELQDKLRRFCRWIDRLDFLKTFNSSFGSGFQFRKPTILEQMSSDVELKEKAAKLFQEQLTLEEVVDRVTDDLEKAGFAEKENEIDGVWKVTAAFHYLEELVDCLTLRDDDFAEDVTASSTAFTLPQTAAPPAPAPPAPASSASTAAPATRTPAEIPAPQAAASASPKLKPTDRQ